MGLDNMPRQSTSKKRCRHGLYLKDFKFNKSLQFFYRKFLANNWWDWNVRIIFNQSKI